MRDFRTFFAEEKLVELLRIDLADLPRGVQAKEDELLPGEIYLHHAKNDAFSIEPESMDLYDKELGGFFPLIED